MLARGRSLPKRVSYIPLRMGPPRLKRSRYLTFKKGRFGVSSVRANSTPRASRLARPEATTRPNSPAAFSKSTRSNSRRPKDPKDMRQDIKDISEKELTKLYSEYQAGLDRPVPAVVHRQGRRIPGCVSVEESAAWKSR